MARASSGVVRRLSSGSIVGRCLYPFDDKPPVFPVNVPRVFPFREFLRRFQIGETAGQCPFGIMPAFPCETVSRLSHFRPSFPGLYRPARFLSCLCPQNRTHTITTQRADEFAPVFVDYPAFCNFAGFVRKRDGLRRPRRYRIRPCAIMVARAPHGVRFAGFKLHFVSIAFLRRPPRPRVFRYLILTYYVHSCQQLFTRNRKKVYTKKNRGNRPGQNVFPRCLQTA